MACTVAPSASIEAWICSSGGVRSLRLLTSYGRIDRAHDIGDVAKAVIPIAQQDEALLFGQRREPRHRRAVEHAEGVLRTIPNERQHHRREGGETIYVARIEPDQLQ